MSKKYRLTGCAKIILVLIILVPAAFFGAAYFTGEDPMEKITATVDQVKGGNGEPYKIKVDSKTDQSKKISTLEDRIEIQEAEIERLKRELNACQNAQ